jgi:ATP-dependent helicase/nuclease subunit A
MSATMPTGTGPQVVAADPNQSVWVSANAGTGKTRVLIDRISRLLLAGTPPGRILCLTFTKAAAAEMDNRLSDRLGHWSAMDDGELTNALAAMFGRPPTEDECGQARRLFAETIEAPEGLRIRTIHSFCESLLGRFPLEANVSPHFSVIDERTAAELRVEARNRVLAGAFEVGSATMRDALGHLAGLVDEAGFGDAVDELDRDRGRLKELIEAQGGIDGLIAGGRRQ